MSVDHAALAGLPVEQVRAAIRTNAYRGHTAGLGSGKLQVNLAILPEADALDFFRFCQRNPKPCPLAGVSDTGDRMMRTLGHDLAVDTDAPSYVVYEHGKPVQTLPDIRALWRDDLVAFALGCSFTFEHAMQAEGIPMRHVACNTTVPMFRSNIPCVQAGVFGGDMVVSMRPVASQDLERVQAISAAFPMAHGGPVHVGDPTRIGISDLECPDWGDPVPFEPGEIPVFWACGVTPQNAAIAAKLPLFISHQPGAMLITDVDERANPPVLGPVT